MFAGVLMLILGVLMLLNEMDFLPVGDVWDYFWPACIVALGIHMIFKSRKPVA